MYLKFNNGINRLIISSIFAICTYICSGELINEPRFFLCYDSGIVVYLSLLIYKLSTTTQQAIAVQRFNLKKEKYFLHISIFLSSLMIFLALNTIVKPEVWNMHTMQRTHDISVITIFLSWIALIIFFAIYYAKTYYSVYFSESNKYKGFTFPYSDEEIPDYWDFFFISFLISITFSTGDLYIDTKNMRRLVMLHTFISFWITFGVFSTVINSFDP